MRTAAFAIVFGATLSVAAAQETNRSTQAEQPAARVAIDAASGNRLPLLTRAAMADEESRRIYDALADSIGEPPRGTIAIALHSPGVAASLGRIDTYLRSESTLEPQLRALLGVVAARELSLPYDWHEHYRAALQAELSPAVV